MIFQRPAGARGIHGSKPGAVPSLPPANFQSPSEARTGVHYSLNPNEVSAFKARARMGTTPLGLEVFFGAVTQGSSFLATLG